MFLHLGGAFLLGLMGTPHCLAMCGPIALANARLPGNPGGTGNCSKRRTAGSAWIQTGRGLGYMSLGLLAGATLPVAQTLTSAEDLRIAAKVICGLSLLVVGLLSSGLVAPLVRRLPRALDVSSWFRARGCAELSSQSAGSEPVHWARSPYPDRPGGARSARGTESPSGNTRGRRPQHKPSAWINSGPSLAAPCAGAGIDPGTNWRPAALTKGLLWALLPCGLIYAALGLAVSAGSAPAGSLVMLAFFVGTLPAMTFVLGALRALETRFSLPRIRLATGLLVALAGLVQLQAVAATVTAPKQSSPAGGPPCPCH